MSRLIFIGLIVALTACAAPPDHYVNTPLSAAQIASVEQVVAHDLRDPDAAQFRNIRHVDLVHTDGTVQSYVCGEVNGKNAFGAYVGFVNFEGEFKGNEFQLKWMQGSDNGIASLYCANTQG